MNPITRYLRSICVSLSLLLTTTGLVKSACSMNNISSSPSTLPPTSSPTEPPSGTSSSSDNSPSAITSTAIVGDVATLDSEEGKKMASKTSAEIAFDQDMTTQAHEAAQASKDTAQSATGAITASIAASATVINATAAGVGAHDFTSKI